MLHAFSRTERLLGPQALAKLADSRVAVFGIGGVGTFAVEGLARSGVRKFLLVDDDLVCLTNINRQIHATYETIGRVKVEVMRERILTINPQAEVSTFQKFYVADETTIRHRKQPGQVLLPLPQALTWSDILAYHLTEGQHIDYIVDAIDTITAKLDLVVQASGAGIPIISCMGAGNKLDPTRLEVADIYTTSVCPLARVMRQELRKRNVHSLKVVYSREEPVPVVATEGTICHLHDVCPKGTSRTCTIRHFVPGSVAFVPSVAGLIIAGEVVKDLCGITP